VSKRNKRIAYANLLEDQFLKTDPVLSIRWVPLTFYSMSAGWENYEYLVQYFKDAKHDFM
jgi:hypothetical protein